MRQLQLIKLRTKPKKPTRREINEAVAVYDGHVLQDIIDRFQGFDLSQVSMIVDRWGGFDGDAVEISFTCSRSETDEELEYRTLEYEEKLAEWKLWYKKNKKTIIAEHERQSAEKQSKSRVRLLKEKARLHRQLAKLEKLEDEE